MNRLLALSVVVVLTACSGGSSEQTPAAPEAAATDAKSTEAVTYVCPMHPNETSTDPKATCNICGMDLELPKKGEASGHEGHDH